MNNTTSWYSSLIKPTWAPPSWVFGPVWTFLYILILISFGFVFYKFFNKQLPFIVVLPFILNLFFNIIFSPIQFVLQNNYLAALDIVFVLGTLVWLMISIWPYIKWVAIMNIPYLIWVLIATVLQFSVTYLNR